MTSVHLFQLSPATIHALANGDLDAATAAANIDLPRYFVEPESQLTWLMRSKQIDADPACAPWITRAIVDSDTGVVVGRAGFHGPPDTSGMVEVGYAVDPLQRRKGYALAAFEALRIRAVREPSVTTLRATIQPENIASYKLISRYAFTENGEQWDEVDGREIIYELDVRNL